MRIFLTGATGYIGFNVAQAFRRAGHQVWGLTRSAHKANGLARQEIQPIIGDMQEPDSYRPVAAQADALVHAAVDYQNDTAELDTLTVKTLLNAAKPGATLIYTSGVWVHGNTNGQVVDETAALKPITAVAWRPDVEQMVLTATRVKGIVIRPGVVYGKGGGLTGAWFAGAVNGGKLQVVGDGRNHWAMVHVDDLAEGYVKAAESGLRGEVFNLVGSTPRVADMVQTIAQAAGADKSANFIPPAEAAETMGAMAEALAIDQQIDARKARTRLAWQPQHPSFVDSVETYLAAWRARQN